MRKRFFACLVTAGLTILGCSDKTEPTPPPGADAAETPDVEIDTGIPAPGEGSEDQQQDEGSEVTEKDQAK